MASKLNQLYFQNGTSVNNRTIYIDSKNEYGIWFDGGQGVWKVGLIKTLHGTKDAVFYVDILSLHDSGQGLNVFHIIFRSYWAHEIRSSEYRRLL
mgnify:CR=1 FL=1